MGYPIELQILAIILWLLLLFFLQSSLIPYLGWIEESFRIPISFASSILLFSLFTWYLALIGIPIQLALIPFLLLFFGGVYSKKISLQALSINRKWYFFFLILFFSLLTLKVLYNPDIDISFEKYTDHMYLASMMHNPHIPPLDAWYVGGTLTGYYYLSQWPYACLGIITGIPSSVVYNLIIPTVFAITSLLIYATSSLFLTRYRFLPLSTLFISYPLTYIFIIPMSMAQFPLILLLNQTLRIIPGAVTENPLTALFIGSPRAYALGMINQGLIIFLLCYLFLHYQSMEKKEKIGYMGLSILCLGSMITMHSWDALLYIPLFVLFGMTLCFIRYSEEVSSKTRIFQFNIHTIPKNCVDQVCKLCILVPLGSILLYLPFLLMMENNGAKGIIWNPVPTEPFLFMLVFGFFIFVLYVAVFPELKKHPLLLIPGIIPALFGFYSVTIALIPLIGFFRRKIRTPIDILAIAGLIILIFCDLFSIADSTGVDRMNTTYKFYFVSWFLLTISTSIMIVTRIQTWNPDTNAGICKKIITCGLIFLIIFTPAFILGVSNPGEHPITLDGASWIERNMPEEMHAIQFLKTMPPGEIIAEGVTTRVGDQDSIEKYFSRVSTFSGIPTILGSYPRELVFRNQSLLDSRVADVAKIYSTNPTEAAEIMKKYGATLLITGYPEYGIYHITNPNIYYGMGFTPIWHDGNTVIWRPPKTT